MEGPGNVCKQYSCTNCKAVFSRFADFKKHLLIHTDKRPHKCTYCDSTFLEKRQLRIHTLTHTGEKTHRCTLCNAVFSDKGNMKRHMRTHTGERPHQCTYCYAAFQQKWHLKVHIMTHTGEKPHKCKLCGASFADKGNLKSHISTHSNEKPHKCSFCDAAFSRKWNLKSHIMSHTGERKHSCPHCEAAFIHSGDLKRHIMTHTKEKPYKCLRCGVTFTRKGGLKIHTMIHTGEKPHKCSLCTAAFSVKANLRSHMKTHAGKKSKKRKFSSPSLDKESKIKYAEDKKINSVSDLGSEKYMKCGSFTQVGKKFHKCKLSQIRCSEKSGYISAHYGESLKFKNNDFLFTAEGKLKSNIDNHNYENSAVDDICCPTFTDIERLKDDSCINLKDHLNCNLVDATFTNDKRAESHTHPDEGFQNYRLHDTGLKDNGNCKAHADTHSNSHGICKVCDTDLVVQSLKTPIKCKAHNEYEKHVKSHMNCHFKESLNCKLSDVSANEQRQVSHVRTDSDSTLSGKEKCKTMNIGVKQNMNEKYCKSTFCKAEDSHKGVNCCILTQNHGSRNLPENQLPCKIFHEEVNDGGNVMGHINPIESKELSECNVCHVEIYCSENTETLDSQKDAEMHRECRYCNADLTDEEKLKIHVNTQSSGDFQRNSIGDTHCYSGREKKSIVVCTDLEKLCKCKICSAELSKDMILKNQMNSNHLDEDLHKCIICNTTFSDFEHLASSVGIHCKKERHSDAECANEERTESLVSTHCNKEHSCKIFGGIFSDEEKFKTHIASHTNDNSLRCKLCNATFTDKRCLRNHIKAHFKGKPHRCTLCDSVFTNEENLEEHRSTHSKETPYKHKLCEVKLANNEEMKKHLISHFADKLHDTWEGKEKSGYMTKEGELSAFKHHDDIILDEGFVTMHNEVHSVPRSQCSTSHSQTYTGEKSSPEFIGTLVGSRSLNCTLCDAAFLVKGTTNHIRIHTGDKTRQAPLSDSVLADGGEIYRIRIYTKDKAHKFTTCNAKLDSVNC